MLTLPSKVLWPTPTVCAGMLLWRPLLELLSCLHRVVLLNVVSTACMGARSPCLWEMVI